MLIVDKIWHCVHKLLAQANTIRRPYHGISLIILAIGLSTLLCGMVLDMRNKHINFKIAEADQ